MAACCSAFARLAAALLAMTLLVGAAERVRVGVIGGGIGGSMAAAFLREQLGAEAEIELWEKETRLCGRVAQLEFEGADYEVGGTIFLDTNRYVFDWARRLGLSAESRVAPRGDMGVFDADARRVVFQTSSFKALTLAKMLARYGPLEFWELRGSVQATLAKWMELYERQARGEAFESAEAFLGALGLFNLTQLPFLELFPSHSRLRDSLLLRELGHGVTSVNYNQPLHALNALVGSVSLAPLLGGAQVLLVREGNFRLCEALARHALAKRVHAAAARVRSAGEALVVEDASGAAHTYDAVIIAAPLELASLDVSGAVDTGVAAALRGGARRFQRMWSTLVRGELRASFWGAEAVDDLPGTLIMANSSTAPPANAVTLMARLPDGDGVFKLYSTRPLERGDLDLMFARVARVADKQWDAYPAFRPPERFPPTRLAPRLFYAGALESAASAMEVAAVWARNCALLAARALGAGNAQPQANQAPKAEL